MKKQSLYLDTSVYGGYFDEEFERFTKLFFNQVNEGLFSILYSTIVQDELEFAPKRIRDFVSSISINNAEIIQLSESALNLASEYIDEKVVGKTSYIDCLHIALATINHADILVSWNFKHIVNVDRIRGYNSINIRNGYQELEIRSPRELIRYETEE